MQNNLKITFDFGLGEEDFTSLARSLEIKECVGKAGKHETQIANLTIKSKELTVKILEATNDIEGFIYEDNILIFSGTVKSSLSVNTHSHIVEPISLSILDNTEKLHCYIYDKDIAIGENIKVQEFTNIPTLNSSDPSNSLFHRLVNLCSNDFTIETEIDIPNLVVQMKLEEGRYIDSYLSALCYEHEIDFRFIGNTIKVFSTKTDRPISKEIPSSALKNNLNINKGDFDADGLKVSYRKFLTVKDYVLATVKKPDATLSNSAFLSDGFNLGYFGGWKEFPTTRDENGKRYFINWDFSLIRDQYDSATPIAISNYRAVLNHKGAYEQVRGRIDFDSCSVEKGKAWIEYKGWYDEVFRDDSISMQILGDVFLSESRKQSTIIKGDNPDSYTAQTISEDDEVKVFATNTNIKKINAQNEFTFLSYEKIEPNSVISLNENKNLNILAKLRVVSRKKDYETNRFLYELEGLNLISITKPIDLIKKEERYPIRSSDFLKIQSTRSKIQSTETLTESMFLVTAEGTSFDKYDLTPNWSIDGKSITAGNPKGFVLSKENLTVGINNIKAQVEYNGETITKVIQVEYIAPISANIELRQSNTTRVGGNYIGEYSRLPFVFNNKPIEVAQKNVPGKNTILVVDGVEKGIVSETSNQSFGIFDISPDEMPIDLITTSERQYIIDGDSYIYHYIKTSDITAADGTTETISEDVYEPYVYLKGEWVLCSNGDGLNYAVVMAQSRDVILADGKNIQPTSVALYGYFQNLAAVDAVFDNVYSKSLIISEQLLKPGSTDEREDFSVNISASRYNESGEIVSGPTFEVKTGNDYLLKIDNDFYDFYEEKTKRALVNGSGDFAITNSRIYMQAMVADGISAKNCNIYGNGSFDILQTPAFVVQPSGRGFVKKIKVVSLNMRLAFDWCLWAQNNNIPFDTMVRCEVSEDPEVGWCIFSTENVGSLSAGDWNTKVIKCHVFFYDDDGDIITSANSYTKKVGVDVRNKGWFGIAWPWLGTHVEYHYESEGKLNRYYIFNDGFYVASGEGGSRIPPIQNITPDFLALQTPEGYGETFRHNPNVTYNGSNLNKISYTTDYPTFNAPVGLMVYTGSTYDTMLNAPALDPNLPSGAIYNSGGVLHVK